MQNYGLELHFDKIWADSTTKNTLKYLTTYTFDLPYRPKYLGYLIIKISLGVRLVQMKTLKSPFEMNWPLVRAYYLQKYRNRLREHFPDVSNHEIRHLSFSIQWFTFSIENWQWSKKTVPKLASAFFCICFPIELYILKIEEQYKKSNYGFPRTGQHILWFMGWNIQCHVSFGQCCPRDRI